MVRRCAWGTCTADCRYPERMSGATFITFPNPKTKLAKCLRWIKACGRPHEQLNVGKINKVICSKHFVGENGPTDLYPDPVPADGSRVTPSRPPPKRQRLDEQFILDQIIDNKENVTVLVDDEQPLAIPISVPCSHDVGCQTDMQTEEIIKLRMENERLHKCLSDKTKECIVLQRRVEAMEKQINRQQTFSVEGIQKREKTVKNLFLYYTGITYVNFLCLLSFLFPNPELKINYGRNDTNFLSNENALFLLLCRLRHDFGLKDLAVRFNLTLQSAGVVFNTILDMLYFKFGQISIWPNRDTIISRMPSGFKRDFPTTLVIIDGTEFKTQTPNALGLQSQLYSDYKSSTTLKALIGCDPSGTVIFISELFTGSISDKLICVQSGFFQLLRDYLKHGYIKHGDGVMADKGFTIISELQEMGLLLNIPPFSTRASQMSVSDTYLSQKIAKHRVHIERLIAKVKTYKLLSHTIPASLFKQINKIWSVCAFLTTPEDFCKRLIISVTIVYHVQRKSRI